MAPFDGGAQGALARRGGPLARGQQPEPVIEARADLLHRQRPDPGRGELDRQRHAVERTADRGDDGGVVRTDDESGPGGGGPVGEQADGLVTVRVLARRVGARGRHGKRRHPPYRLGREAQWLAARGQQSQPRRAGQQPLAQLGAHVDQVLAVIQGQQQPARPQRVGQRLPQRAPGLFADADNRGHARGHQVSLLQVRQLDEPCPIGKLIRDRGQQPQRQPGLPDASGPPQGQRTRMTQHPAQFAELALAADEAIRFLGQMCLDLVHVIPSGLRLGTVKHIRS